MSNNEIVTSVDELIEGVKTLSAAAQNQAENAATLAKSVRENNELSAQNRKILNRVSKLMIAKLVTLVVLFFMVIQVYQVNNRITDCTSPGGKCKQRNDATLVQLNSSFALVNESTRLATEIPIAEAKGDTLASQMRRERLAAIQEQLRQVGENVKAISQNKTLPYPDATRASTPPNQTTEGSK